jgi:DhnA family fructose-bisphosphate aldolase class Ia
MTVLQADAVAAYVGSVRSSRWIRNAAAAAAVAAAAGVITVSLIRWNRRH